MIPVAQTLFGREEGNCLAACVASILELDLADVPNFCADQSDGSWLRKLADWLAERELCAVHASFVDSDPGPKPAPADLVTMSEWLKLRRVGFAIISGYTERGLSHSTVWFDGELAHDPHPGKNPLVNVVDMVVIAHRDPCRFMGEPKPMDSERLAQLRQLASSFPVGATGGFLIAELIELLADRDYQAQRAAGAERDRYSAAAGLAEQRAEVERLSDMLIARQDAELAAGPPSEMDLRLLHATREVTQLRARVEADDVEREAVACAVEALVSEWSPTPGSEVALGWSKILREQLHKAAAMIRSGKAQP
jgi:hypothetical protein